MRRVARQTANRATSRNNPVTSVSREAKLPHPGVMTNDPHLIALGQIEADRAAGRISQAHYERAKAELTEMHLKATRPWRFLLYAIVLIPLLLIAGCFALAAVGGR